ncbi:hypothetical protein I5M27_09875 [Adhaeribacter sp. BT258]|uniref:Uncharacterized protein n=1 Tax=Adhaeribacter terrigena TaxID=2793070 RepID=A0ABS1C1M7_9BACT|nr:hypothetical protein [Adhaeribacter terrigena]MBK0403294.1 hypothetical protein [Adhaeribacter terrigena]
MTFEEYLTKRRVNVAAFAAAEPQRFAEWQLWYSQMHPESFYVMVKMVLNDVRRNFWLAEVPKPVVAPASEAAAAGAPARPAGRRAAIPGPAATATPETAQPEIPIEITAKSGAEIPETKPAETKSTDSETSQEAAVAKPVRPVFKPRAVIRKPTTTSSEEISSETPETVKALETAGESKPKAINSEDIKPETENLTSENPETALPKPARPRAVIKRPAALTKPEETPGKTSGNSVEKAEEPASENHETVGDLVQKVADQNTSETPKPARPRPVFKRPSATASTETSAAEPEKTVGNSAGKVEEVNPETATENPVAIPGQEGASETKAVADEIHDNPEAAKAAEEVAAAAGHVPKPARPRPVFKRPAAITNAPENNAEPGKTLSETEPKPEAKSAEMIPEKPAETAEDSERKPESKTVGETEEKVEEPAPKPPRPRPVFKRPAKPESDKEDPQHL